MSTPVQYRYSKEELKEGSQSTYFEFIYNTALSAGIYTLKVNEKDMQKPHTEDELYYVLAGKSKMRIGKEIFEVNTGDCLYVPAFLEHHFYDIVEELKLLVFFSKVAIKES